MPTTHSSISSSDGWPSGAILGVVFIVLIHIGATALYPRPIARDDLRQRVRTLTAAAAEPLILVAGDSRAHSQVIPRVVAEQVGVSSKTVVNIAAPRSATPTARALYNEFAGRFSRRPLMILNVSLAYGNDGANPTWYLTDELLWSLNLLDRYRVAGTSRAALATFMPERALYRACKHKAMDWLGGGADQVVDHGGYRGNGVNKDMPLPSAEWDRQIDIYRRNWFGTANVSGAKWQQLRRDIQALLDAGVRVVMTDMPEHPEFHRRLAGTMMERVNSAFDRGLQELAAELSIPLWNYNWSNLGLNNPDDYFVDALHLNEQGALKLSGLVGQDIRQYLHTEATSGISHQMSRQAPLNRHAVLAAQPCQSVPMSHTTAPTP